DKRRDQEPPSRDNIPLVKHWLKNRGRKIFSRKFLYRKLPIVKWLPLYRLGDLPHDLLAGITVALTAIPQGIAYAIVAGLGPQAKETSFVSAGQRYGFVSMCWT
ncbi:unnamed protein product, partial [Timema podura]|nr:unnamed protein product [Timema podura]